MIFIAFENNFELAVVTIIYQNIYLFFFMYKIMYNRRNTYYQLRLLLLIHLLRITNRYIEIFRSSLSEVRASIGPKMRGGPMSGFNQRPAPYDRGSRFGGMNRFNNNGRGNRGGNRGQFWKQWSANFYF